MTNKTCHSCFNKYFHITCAVHTHTLKTLCKKCRLLFQLWPEVSQMLALHRRDLFSQDVRRKRLFLWHASSSNLMCPQVIVLHVTDAGTPATAENHVNTAHAHSLHCVHTWPGTKWTTQCHPSPSWDTSLAVSHTSQHIDETGWHRSTRRERCGCDSPLPLFHPAITCPATHSYAHRDRCTNTACKQTRAGIHTNINLRATHTKTQKKHAQDSVKRWCQYLASHCDSLSGCWMSVVNWADRNKHISYSKFRQCLPLDLTQAAQRSAPCWRQSTEIH